MNLYLIRHGEYLGQLDPTHYSNPDSPLSALGEQQAVLTAKHLSRANLSCVVSSPLVRALATAAPIAQSFNIPVLVWTDIREGFSDYHKGFSLAKLQTEFPNTQFSEEVTEEGWHHGNDFYDEWWIWQLLPTFSVRA
jgi:2,3-bisphosphoglycerate-dependent phosphoglycerate mutase